MFRQAMLRKYHETNNGGIYGSQSQSTFSHGTETTCELCRTERRCFDRFGMVACAGCLNELLP